MINKETMDRVKYVIAAMYRNEDPKEPKVLLSTDAWLYQYGVGAGAGDCIYKLMDVETLTDENRKEIINAIRDLLRNGKEEVGLCAEGMHVCNAPCHAYIIGYNLAIRNALTLLRAFETIEVNDNYMRDWYGIDYNEMRGLDEEETR